MGQPIRVVIVNDYEVVVRGLVALLQPYADRIHVVEAVAGHEPSQSADIVLYDTFAAPPGRRVDSVTMRRTYRATHLVIYTWHVTEARRAKDLRGEVAGYLSKTLSAVGLVRALEQVHAGVRVVSTGPATSLAESDDWIGREVGLSARESEIVALIVEGLNNDAIAGRAYLSINTVKSYVRTTYRKIGVSSRSQALLWGLDHGFRPVPVRTEPAGSAPDDEPT